MACKDLWSRIELPYETVNEDEALRKLALSQGKQVSYEMTSGLAFAQFMAAMPDAARSQYIEFLLDFMDDAKRGLNIASLLAQGGTYFVAVRVKRVRLDGLGSR